MITSFWAKREEMHYRSKNIIMFISKLCSPIGVEKKSRNENNLLLMKLECVSHPFSMSERNNYTDLSFNREVYDKKYFKVFQKQYTKVRSFSTMVIPVIPLELEMGEKLSFKLLKCSQ